MRANYLCFEAAMKNRIIFWQIRISQINVSWDPANLRDFARYQALPAR
jgi:hypothetical protein